MSGGNQQKIVVAKWLARDCDILFFDEPTRGIDVGAKAEIYKLLRGLADQGKAIVMISSELPEILRMSDRIVVMCEGRITGELTAEEASQERIMQLATQRESDGGLRAWTTEAWLHKAIRAAATVRAPRAGVKPTVFSARKRGRSCSPSRASSCCLIYFSFASPAFMQTDNMINILQATAVNGVLAIASTFIIITAGIDLSVGTLMTFTAVMAGVFLTYWGLPMWTGVLAALATGALAGSISGTLIAKLKIPPFIATLGMMQAWKGLSLVVSADQADLFHRHRELLPDLAGFADRLCAAVAADPQRRADPIGAGDRRFDRPQ